MRTRPRGSGTISADERSAVAGGMAYPNINELVLICNKEKGQI